MTGRYLTLATFSGARPWAATLYYLPDDRLRLLFASPRTARHSQDVRKNPVIAATIFDSHQAAGIGTGVQIEGECIEVPKEEVAAALEYYSAPFLPHIASYFYGHSTYRLYRITPSAVYLPDPAKRIDVRRNSGLI